MELEELSARLSDLERSRDEDRQKAAQQAFMGKYGSRISNNESLGLVVLNELNRKGVDTSAADEAVTEILDQLRMEATALLDAINDYKDKVDDVTDAFETAEEVVGGESDTSKPTSEVQEDLALEPGSEEGGEAPETPPSDMAGEDVGMPPLPPDMPGQPAPDMGGAPAPDMGGMPPPDMGGAPAPDMSAPPPPDQNMQLSDRRFKNIQNIVSDRRMKRIKQPATPKPAKPAVSNMLSEIINACRGGISNE